MMTFVWGLGFEGDPKANSISMKMTNLKVQNFTKTYVE